MFVLSCESVWRRVHISATRTRCIFALHDDDDGGGDLLGSLVVVVGWSSANHSNVDHYCERVRYGNTM